MQVCHGKAAPLRRIHAGDGVVYYSPTEQFGGAQALRAFTAIGVVAEGAPYAFEMEEGFCPFRRDVRWLQANETPIAPLLPTLDFTAGKRNWGYPLRFGLCALSAADWQRIAQAMGAQMPLPSDDFVMLQTDTRQGP